MTPSKTKKAAAIDEIRRLMGLHGITIGELQQSGRTPLLGPKLLQQVFHYLGGILIFAGIGVFATMFWDNLHPAGQIAATLGSGLLLFSVALVLDRHENYEKLVAPFFLMSSLLQPVGLVILLTEMSIFYQTYKITLLVSAFMLLQQIPAFLGLRRSILIFTILFFYGVFVLAAFNLLGLLPVYSDWVFLMLGMSYMLISSRLSRKDSSLATGSWFFIGAVCFIVSFWLIFRWTTVGMLFPIIAGLLIYVSVKISSRALLLVGTLSLLWYIGDFTHKYFEDSFGWPAALIVSGLNFILIGGWALKLNRKLARN